MRELFREYRYTLKCLAMVMMSGLFWLLDIYAPSFAKNSVIHFLEHWSGPSYLAYLAGNLASSLINANTQKHLPSLNATFLFYFFLDATTCDALVGDLEERYKFIFKKFGRLRADLWYWKETFCSVGPVAWGWIKRLVMKPAITLGSWMLGHGLFKDSSIMELVKSLLAEWLKRMRG